MYTPSLKDWVESLKFRLPRSAMRLAREAVATPRIGSERFGAFTDDDAVQQILRDAVQLRELDRKKGHDGRSPPA